MQCVSTKVDIINKEYEDHVKEIENLYIKPAEKYKSIFLTDNKRTSQVKKKKLKSKVARSYAVNLKERVYRKLLRARRVQV